LTRRRGETETRRGFLAHGDKVRPSSLGHDARAGRTGAGPPDSVICSSNSFNSGNCYGGWPPTRPVAFPLSSSPIFWCRSVRAPDCSTSPIGPVHSSRRLCVDRPPQAPLVDTFVRPGFFGRGLVRPFAVPMPPEWRPAIPRWNTVAGNSLSSFSQYHRFTCFFSSRRAGTVGADRIGESSDS
jgi:hypothetical protein